MAAMPEKKPYTHVRLICSDDGDINQRYEIRVSTFVQFDDNAGRRSMMFARIGIMRVLNHGKLAPEIAPRRKKARIYTVIR